MRHDAANSLDRYCASLRGIRPLDADTEKALAARYREGDAEAGRRIVEANLPFVIRVALKYRRWGVPLEDLVQQGNIGLLRAAEKFDPARSCRLITYAVYWIRAEIRAYVVRGYRMVRLGTTRAERKAVRAFRCSAVESVDELQAASGMPRARAEKLWPLLLAHDVSLDARPDGGSSGLDSLAGDAPSPEELAVQREDHAQTRAALAGALGLLSARERRILEARIVADEPLTLEALGGELGVSKERVRQLEQRVRSKLRASFESLHGGAVAEAA